jgi:hypothetical protein
MANNTHHKPTKPANAEQAAPSRNDDVTTNAMT